MKILEAKYPLGSLPRQQSAGRYCDKNLHDNLDILAKAIGRDMTWMGILSSSTLEVGTGKSTIAQHICEAYLDLVNKYQGTNLELTMRNIIFRPKDIIQRAFKVPQYSCIIIDEWEDAHYWSELGVSLRQFFRKCRQLNLFILLIIPNFFQLPANYAISRSVFFIDVRFEGEFERGYFRFYNFDRKKDLYIKGKKTQDYGVVRANFTGRFTEGYVVDEKEYRAVKRRDLEKQEEGEKKELNQRQLTEVIFKKIYDKLPKVTIKQLTDAMGVSERTGNRWILEVKAKEMAEMEQNCDSADNYINNTIQDDDVMMEKRVKEPIFNENEPNNQINEPIIAETDPKPDESPIN